MRKNGTRKVCSLHSFNLSSRTDTDLVLRQCALEPDLLLFEAGDKTEVGEKGLTLRCVIQIGRRQVPDSL
jgi:hypothetical protein